MIINKGENMFGNNVYEAKNAINVYDVTGIENCKHLSCATNMKVSIDVDYDDNSELVYESI